MIGIVTDSNSQLPDELRARFGIEVVPLTVTIDGDVFREGVDITADEFYARFEGRTPVVTTTLPSPGEFSDAYARLAAAGADSILSIHIGSTISGTLNSARIASLDAPVPVRLVDTGTASFGISCCVWEAAEALVGGASLEDAAELAEQLAASVGNVFMVRALDLARAGGRLATNVEERPEALPVLSMVHGEIRAVGQAHDIDEAVTAMADYVLLRGGGGGRDEERGHLRVALGVADVGSAPLARALEEALAGSDLVKELVHYRIGPSVGVHTGPGTAGAFFYPAVV